MSRALFPCTPPFLCFFDWLGKPAEETMESRFVSKLLTSLLYFQLDEQRGI
jgi:hypothetical protein